MGRRPGMTFEQRHIAIGMLTAGDRLRDVAKHCKNVLQQLNIPTLYWPAHSSDLSPIEHLWDYLGRQLKERQNVNDVIELERTLYQK